MDFEEWLSQIYNTKSGKNISKASVNKYLNAVKVINKEMQEIKVIKKSIYEMDIYELDVAIEKIFAEEGFIKKDTVGNRMYSCAIKRYRCFRHYILDSEEKDHIDIFKNHNTERKQIVNVRIAQQKFKKDLLNKYHFHCIITNLSIRPVLIASHIKPWAVSNNYERTDVNNGLLLSATIDRLFDSGLITFDENGKMILSNIISKQDKKILNFENGTKYDLKIEGKMKEYLKYHNEMIFVK